VFTAREELVADKTDAAQRGCNGFFICAGLIRTNPQYEVSVLIRDQLLASGVDAM
jgi:hypothetical protein